MTSSAILALINNREPEPVVFHDLTGPAHGPLLLHFSLAERRREERKSRAPWWRRVFRPQRGR